MESVGKQLKAYCTLVSHEMLTKKCDYEKRLGEATRLNDQVNELLGKTKVVTITDLPFLRKYQPNLESLIDGLKRVIKHKELNNTLV